METSVIVQLTTSAIVIAINSWAIVKLLNINDRVVTLETKLLQKEANDKELLSKLPCSKHVGQIEETKRQTDRHDVLIEKLEESLEEIKRMLTDLTKEVMYVK